jgi:hypothetical protein
MPKQLDDSTYGGSRTVYAAAAVLLAIAGYVCVLLYCLLKG